MKLSVSWRCAFRKGLKKPSKHHRKPKSQGGKLKGKNKSVLPRDLHDCWHDIVFDYSPSRVANSFTALVIHKWISIRYWKNKEVYFEAHKRDEVHKTFRLKYWVDYEKYRRIRLGESWLQRKLSHNMSEAFHYAFGKKSIKAFLREVNETYLDPDYILIAYQVRTIKKGRALIELIR